MFYYIPRKIITTSEKLSQLCPSLKMFTMNAMAILCVIRSVQYIFLMYGTDCNFDHFMYDKIWCKINDYFDSVEVTTIMQYVTQ